MDTFPTHVKRAAGQGYRYGTKDILFATDLLHGQKPSFADYAELLRWHDITVDNPVNYYNALTNLAFFMASKVWSEVENAKKGKLFFEIGGINSVNPFHVTGIKNELFVYAGVVRANGYSGQGLRDTATEGYVFDQNGNHVSDPVTDQMYTRLYLDFSGSMAFFNPDWREKLELSYEKIAACFVMGGVFTDKEPTTMPALAGFMNRFSCATMNQFYHPENSYRFFRFLKFCQVQTFTVCNNTIPDLKTFTDSTRSVPSDEGWISFLQGNSLTGSFLHQLAHKYYNSPYGGPHKAFDYYTALALARHAEGRSVTGTAKTLIYNPKYAATLVDPIPRTTFHEAVNDYTRQINRIPDANDSAFITAKKENMNKELILLSGLATKVILPVTDLSFTMDATSRHLTLNP